MLTILIHRIYNYNMSGSTEDTAFLHIRIKKELLDEAKKKALKAEIPLSQVVRILVSEWVKNPQQKLFF